MRWILGFVTVLVIFLAVAALVAPRLIEWNAYRPVVTATITERTGLQAVVGGDLYMVLLPAPTLFATDLRLSAPGRPGQELVQVESLRTELDLWSLLLGDVRLREIALQGPTFNLDLDDPGWATTVLADRIRAMRPGSPGAREGDPGTDTPLLHDILVQDGRVLVVRGAETVLEAEGLRLDFVAPVAGRPGRLTAEANLAGLPLAMVLDVGSPAGGGGAPLRLRADLADGLALASYGGVLAPVRPDDRDAPVSEGSLTVTVREPGNLLSLLGAMGEQGPGNGPAEGLPAGSMQEPLTASARVVVGGRAAILNDFDLRWGRATVGGALTADFGPPLDMDLTLQAAGLELGPLLHNLRAVAGSDRLGALLSTDMRLVFDIGASTLRFHDSLVRDLHLAGVLEGGVLDLRQARAELPGSTWVQLQGRMTAPAGQSEFDGELAVEAADARRTLAWLGMPEDLLPTARPRRVQGRADLMLDGGLWRLVNLEAELDGAGLRGGIAMRRSGRPSFSANLRLEGVDLDPYLVRPAAVAPLLAPTLSASDRLGELGTALSAFDSNLRLRGSTIAVQGQVFQDVQLDLSLVRGELSLSRAEFASVDGLRAAASGSVSAEPGYLAYDLDLLGEAERPAALLRWLPIADPGLAAGGMPSQPLRARLRLTGDTSQALVRDLHLAMPGAELSGNATVGLETATPSLVAGLAWKLSDAAQLPFEIGQADFLAVMLPASGNAVFTVDAGAIAVNGMTLSLPLLTLTGEGRHSRDVTPAQFSVSLGAQADSLPSLLQGLGMPLALSAPAMVDRPLTLLLDAGGTSDAVLFRRARLEVGGATLDVRGGGRLGPDPGFAGSVSIEAQSLAELLEGLGLSLIPADPDLGPVRVDAQYALGRDALTLQSLAGRAGPVEIGGSVNLDWSERMPRLEGSLHLADLPLDRLLPAGRDGLDLLLPTAADPAAGLGAVAAARAEGRSRADALLPGPADIAVDLMLDATGVSGAGGAFTGGSLALHLTDRWSRLTAFEGALLGGRVSGWASLDRRGLPAFELEAEATDLDAARTLARLGIAPGLGGTADVVLRLRTAGDTRTAMRDAMAGQAEVDLRDGMVAGIDLPALVALVDSPTGAVRGGAPEAVAAAVEAALLGGRTALRSGSGILFIEGGVVRLQRVQAALDGGTASYHGSIDLPGERLDLAGSYRLASVTQSPPIDFRLRGLPAAPEREVQADAFLRFVALRAASAPLTPTSPPVPTSPPIPTPTQ